jgi:hypothetical protein
MAHDLTYRDLLRLNAFIRKNSDSWFLHCTTRTVQESKLFPTPAYMTLSYLQAYYRYPELLRKLTARISPEDIGDRLREVDTRADIIGLSCIPQFFLAGRQLLIDMGMLKPTDGLDDVAVVQDFGERLNLAYHRNHAHTLPSDAGLRAQVIPERRAQVFEADAIGMRPGDRLHVALKKYMATANQYALLTHCESRLGINNHGPYRTRPNEEMLVRSYVDLGEGDLPWLDGVASEVPHNNLTIPVILRDTHFNIVDDWGSFEATPSYDHDKTVAVGCYTSDFLSDGEIPVAMDNASTLADYFEQQSDVLGRATTAMWRVMAGWTRDQMLDAGALIYFGVGKDIFHLAGLYDPDDWFQIDERAARFKPLLNDEYARDFLGELLGFVDLPSQQGSSYTMAKYNDGQGDMWWTVPYSVLTDDEYTLTSGPMAGGSTSLSPKQTPYLTTRGRLSLDEYNTAAAAFTPTICQEPYRFLDDAWVRGHAGTPLADELYRIEQERSPSLKGRGSTVTRADVDEIRSAQVVPDGGDLTAAQAE